MKNENSDVEDEVEIDEPTVTSRLAEPIKKSKILNNLSTEFVIANGEQVDEEEDTDMLKVYSYDDVEPYILPENFDVDSDDEGDDANPILPFSTYQKKMECITDDGKVKKLLEKCGLGGTVNECGICVVYIHYSMYHEHEECPFDVSRLRQKKPIALRLGSESIIDGMVIAIQTMKKGEKSKFLIAPEYAYGKLGVPPRIPPDATILVDIELIDFTNNEDIVASRGKDDDDIQQERTFEETYHCAEKLRHHGNKLKGLRKDINGAIRDYRRGICLLVNFNYANAKDENKARELMLVLYSNLCLSYNIKNSYRQACTAYNNARHDCPHLAENYPKLLYHSAKALRHLGDYKEAVARLKRALRIKPDNEDILRELDLTTKERAEFEKKEKNMYRSMFGFRKNVLTDENDEFEENLKTVNKEFQNMIISQIKTMVESDQDSMKLTFGATSTEKDFCEKLCKKNNMSFRVTKADGVETFIITKKS